MICQEIITPNTTLSLEVEMRIMKCLQDELRPYTLQLIAIDNITTDRRFVVANGLLTAIKKPVELEIEKQMQNIINEYQQKYGEYLTGQ
jgi:hypothetical protein